MGKKIVVPVYLTDEPELYELIRKKAFEQRITMSEVIRIAIRSHFEKELKK